MKLSKSRFVAGCQCLRRLYWQVHEPELAARPDAAAEAIIQQGQEVGMLARTLFPGGVEVDCSRGLADAIRTTRELIANPEISAIFECVFEHQNVLVKVDILHRRRDGRWRLIEVKSTTDVRDHHIEDVGIQYRTLSRSGVDVAFACLAHVNRNYIRDGEIDPRRFFRIRNLTRRIERLLPKLTFQLRSEFTVLAMPQPPDVVPGMHCMEPITCEFYERCNPPRPNDHIGYAVLLYERYLGRPFATHRDSVSELVGDVMEQAIEERLARARVTFRKTRRAERVPGFEQAPDFFIPDEFNPAVLIEAKMGSDDGTVRDKITRIQRLATMRDDRIRNGQQGFQVVACIDGRGFGVRRQDMRNMLTRLEGKVFTLATLDQLIPNTRIRDFLPEQPQR